MLSNVAGCTTNSTLAIHANTNIFFIIIYIHLYGWYHTEYQILNTNRQMSILLIPIYYMHSFYTKNFFSGKRVSVNLKICERVAHAYRNKILIRISLLSSLSSHNSEFQPEWLKNLTFISQWQNK